MPITLVTGTPGAGKTLRALQLARAAAQSGRAVYVDGVDGTPYEAVSFVDWLSIPDGAIYVVDEAWRYLGPSSRIPLTDPVITGLATHRHRGLDVILVCQSPAQIHRSLRGVIGAHEHIRRKFGTATCVLYRWPHVQGSPDHPQSQRAAEESVWPHPTDLYGSYQSATVHTIRRRVPPRVLVGVAAALLVPVVLALGAWVIWRQVVPGDDSAATSAANSPREAGGQTVAATRLTPPVVVGVFRIDDPRNPIYDEFQAVTYPRIFCVIGGDMNSADPTTCRCITQQGTRFVTDSADCHDRALSGRFDPRLPDPQERFSGESALSPVLDQRL